jgi:hypothetical protein
MNHKTMKRGYGQRFKKARNIVLVIVSGVFILSILSPQSFGQENEKENNQSISISQLELKTNPFELKPNRIVPGTIFKVAVDKTRFAEKNWSIDEIKLIYSTSPGSKNKTQAPIESWYFKEIEGDLYIFARMPGWETLARIRKQSPWRGIFTPYRADLSIDYHNSGNKLNIRFAVELPDQKWALIWGLVLAVLLVLLLAWLTTGDFALKELFSLKKLVLSVKGNISVSKTQVLIWTFIVIFGIIYVYRISEVLLEITPQVLLLLGIGGGTAVAAKYTAVRKNGGTPPPPSPVPQNAAGGDANAIKAKTGSSKTDFFKVQMLSFTVVIAVIVLIEILKTNAFPSLSENLVIVMGISNAVYLGNKTSEKKQTGDS